MVFTSFSGRTDSLTDGQTRIQSASGTAFSTVAEASNQQTEESKAFLKEECDCWCRGLALWIGGTLRGATALYLCRLDLTGV